MVAQSVNNLLQFIPIMKGYLSYSLSSMNLLGHFADYRVPLKGYPLSILKIARMTISNEKG